MWVCQVLVVAVVSMWCSGAVPSSLLVLVEGGDVMVVNKGLECGGIMSRRIPGCAEEGDGIAGP